MLTNPDFPLDEGYVFQVNIVIDCQVNKLIT
jgi:hypothetical protein